MHQLTTLFSLSTQGMTRGTWSPVTVGSHSQDGRWSSAISAAYGCTCRARRSRNPTFPTSFTATSAGTCGGRDTKRTPRHEEDGWDPQEHPPCFFCCPLDSCFLWCLQPKQPKLSPGWQPYCHFVGFLFDNHNHSYLSLTFCFVLFVSYLFFIFFGYCEEVDRRLRDSGESFYLLLINSSINWL